MQLHWWDPPSEGLARGVAALPRLVSCIRPVATCLYLALLSVTSSSLWLARRSPGTGGAIWCFHRQRLERTGLTTLGSVLTRRQGIVDGTPEAILALRP